MAVANTLAYDDSAIITSVKGFTVQAQVSADDRHLENKTKTQKNKIHRKVRKMMLRSNQCHFCWLLVLVQWLSTGIGQKLNGCSVEVIIDPFLQDHLRETYFKQR
jgi:hypothetical protein